MVKRGGQPNSFSLTFAFRNLDLVEKGLTLLNGLVELGFSCERILLDFLPSFSRERITYAT